MQSESNTFWVRGYLPNGFNVSFTIATTPETAYDDAMRFTTALLAQGLTIHEPGLEPGQKREAVSQIVIGRKKEDGTLFADLYPAESKLVQRITRVYFDPNTEVTDTFQKFSGYSLSQDHKIWGRNNPIKRGENKEDDAYLITLPHTVSVVMEQNPDYVAPPPGQMGTTKRWIVKRFEPLSQSTPPPAAPAAQPTGNPFAVDPTLATSVVIRESKAKQMFLAVLNAKNAPLGVAASRKLFADAGYDTQSWTGVGTRIELNPPARISTVTTDGTIAVVAVAQAA